MKKGISLIALIITIIVIIILAVITIFGVNGVIEKAREAKILQEISNEKEIVSAAVIQAKKGINSFNEETLGKAMDNITGIGETYVFADSDNLAVQFKKSERYYLVDKDGVIEGPVYPIEDEYAGDLSKGGKYDGSEEKPYQINCIEDLVAFSIMSHGGNTEIGLGSNWFINKYVELVRTLDFKSIFSYNDPTTKKYRDLNEDGIEEDIKTELTKKDEGCIGFKGITRFNGSTFDGQGYSIKNVYMHPYDGGVSFFGSMSIKLIKDLTITGEIISVTGHASAFASGVTEAIINCKNYTNVIGLNLVGGLVQSTNSLVSNCENYGTITITGGGYGAGGITGQASGGTIENCKNYGKIIKDSSAAVDIKILGGIAGRADNESKIINCANYGNNEFGGIVGMDGIVDIINCFNMGDCSGGISMGTTGASSKLNIINCYNLGECHGGMISELYYADVINIKNSYNLGSGNSGFVGNLYYHWSDNEVPVNIENCYNAGNNQNAIIGSILNNSTVVINITNTYYDKSKSTGIGVIADGVTGLTYEEMRNQKTVLDTGKTFVEILNENIGANEDWKHWTVGANGYPVFVSE